MKTVLPFLLCFFIVSETYAGLSPAATSEFCPNTSISFTFTVTGRVYSPFFGGNVYTIGSINTTGITYNSATDVSSVPFTLQFNDISQNHKITITWSNGSQNLSEEFTFAKVKSLYDFDSVVSPNITSFNVDSCEVKSMTVSFAKLPWKNTQTGDTFGEIPDYSYSVPTGWKVNGSPSTGTSDIKYAGNSVTIESDNIHDGTILIRAVNLCTTGLLGAQYTKPISIVRSKPGLTFQSAQFICSSASFQANNVPSWVTSLQWSTSPYTLFSISSTASNPTTITRNFDGQGQVSVLISGTGCPYSFSYNTSEITGAAQLVAGKPTVSTDLALYTGSGSENEVCQFQENYIPCKTLGYSNTGYPAWSYVSHSGSPQPSWNGTNEDIYIYFFNSHQNSLVLQLDASNSCGTTSYQFGFVPVTCALRTKPSSYNISPNPTTGIIRIIPKETASNGGSGKASPELAISKVEIYDFYNARKLSQTFDYVSSASVNLRSLPPGTYIVIITNRVGTESQQVILK